MFPQRVTPHIVMAHLEAKRTVVDQAATRTGHYVLVEIGSPHGSHYELRIDGRYAMSSYCRESESELAHLSLAMLGKRPGAHVLVGGLGVGFTLREALKHDWVARVTVVEIQPLVVAWARNYFHPFHDGALDDSRTHVVIDDIGAYIEKTRETFDVIMLDMDNGPHDPLLPRNVRLYSEEGLRGWAARLSLGGVLAVWSARRDDEFVRRLRRVFPVVESREVFTGISAEGAESDIVYLAGRTMQESR